MYHKKLPLLVLGSLELGDTGAGGVDVDGALVGLALEVDIEAVVILGVGKDLGSVQGHDVVGNRLDRLGGKVHVVNSKVSIRWENK